MNLSDYPRPPNDAGIGVHWSASNPAAVGLADLREYWIPQMIDLGVSWVKLLHDDGVGFAELLLQDDIMPVVRLYRHRPNSIDPAPGKGTLGEKEIEYIKRYVAAGVRYFEFNNEPELHGEWEGGHVPPNAETIVARHAIIDMETILGLGGYPAVPATAVGTKWDLVGKIIDLGRVDLFNEPIWVAVHNYDINHPLDYPYDAVNQQGQQLTREEYDELDRQGAWYGRNWGYRPLDFVNEQRRLGMNAGHTVHDDPSCWLAYARLDELVQQHLGRSLPLLSTENGPLINEDDDPRYPTTTLERQRDKVLEMCRIMMGTSERFAPAPPQYFCTAFWLIAGSLLLGSWESHAWYSPTRSEGRLPVVDALKALPKKFRPDFVPPWEEGVIEGRVSNGAGYSLLLEGPVSDITEIAGDDTFRFERLRAGTYTLTVRGTELSEEVRLTKSRQTVIVDIELTPELVTPSQESVLRGQVRGGAGYVLRLSGPADRFTTIADDESYCFQALPAGEYALAVEGTAVSTSGILLDGRTEQVLDLEVSVGWTWESWDGGGGPGFGIVRCTVEGLANLPVRLWTDGWGGITQLTGSKAEYGPFACEFAPLGGGHYYVAPQGLDVQAELRVDGSRVLWVAFREGTSGDDEGSSPPLTPAASSIIHGRVLGGGSYVLELRSGLLFHRETRPNDGAEGLFGSYRFEGLTAGTYTLRLLRVVRHDVRPGEWYESQSAIPGQVRDGIQLDGENEVVVDFDMRLQDPIRGTSVLNGLLHGGAGQQVVLTWPGGYRSEEWVGEDGTFYFRELGAGTYELQVKGTAVDQTFQTDGQEEVSLDLWLPSVHSGVIWGQVQGGAGQQIVLIWSEGRQEMTIAPNGAYRFAHLPPGEYELRVAQTSVTQSGILLDADETIEVNLELPPPKSMEHYLLLGAVPADWRVFVAAMRYASRFGPVLGDSVDAARQATHVTIIGDQQAVSAETEQSLLQSDCQVHRIQENVASELEQLVKEGRPY